MPFLRFLVLAGLLVVGFVTGARAAAPTPMPSASALPVPHVPDAVTHRTVTIHGTRYAYTATAGTIDLTNAEDQTTASVFYVAYVLDGTGPHERRPLTFAFNGGPGSASALLHIGALGPRTVVTTDAAATHPPPYDLVENQDSLLPTSDLVFVDAVGTGFSRIAGKGEAKNLYGVDQDGHAFAQFVRRYVTTNERWNSPKYLVGESYGTTRACVLAKMLQDDGIALTGVTLLSSAISFSSVIPQPGNDRFYEAFLPTEAAVAVYHHRVPEPPDLDAYLREVRAYALGPYETALAKGGGVPPAERDDVARRLAAYTGLSAEYIARSRLRVVPERFEKELLGASERSIGRYDGRFSGDDLDPIQSEVETEPSSDAVSAAFVATFNRYVREDLHYVTSAKYVFLNYDVNKAWDWSRGTSSPVGLDVSDDLAATMTADPFLHVFSANGLYDLATPFFGTELALDHLAIAPALRDHISYGYYRAGHMVYLNPAAHAAFERDLERLYTRP